MDGIEHCCRFRRRQYGEIRKGSIFSNITGALSEIVDGFDQGVDLRTSLVYTAVIIDELHYLRLYLFGIGAQACLRIIYVVVERWAKLLPIAAGK